MLKAIVIVVAIVSGVTLCSCKDQQDSPARTAQIAAERADAAQRLRDQAA
jgi:hypothetical protein